MVDPKILDAIWKEGIIGFAKVSPEGDFLDVNPAFCEIVEYGPSELKQMNFKKITHPEDLDDDWAMVKMCLAGELKGYSMAKRYITRSGFVTWIKLKVTALHDPDTKQKVLFFLAQAMPIPSNIAASPSNPKELSFIDSSVFSRFFKRHWKWLLGVTVGAIAASYRLYHEWETMRLAMEQQEQQIIELMKIINSMKGK